MKKNIENSEPAIRTAITYEAVRVREAKMSPGTSGALTRRSITTNASRSSAASASSAIVSAEPQPLLLASTSA